MRKNRTLRVLAVLSAAPALLFATAAAAHADGNIKWQDDATGYCLRWQTNWLGNTATVVGTGGCSGQEPTWHEVNNGDGTYALQTAYGDGSCLTGYGTSVYLEGCQKNNDYEKWSEEQQPNGGWKLKNKATQRYLDSNWNKDVYLSDWNDGPYQLWH
ncbi:RICIN domain-containing protein [Streptomyces sp. NPDC052396]|uniref:RICIN domain-containing protein n=1 Tax=Streptomyces sp. NPDC052396 TaxID=3365689 RepID=UPI0037CCF715